MILSESSSCGIMSLKAETVLLSSLSGIPYNPQDSTYSQLLSLQFFLYSSQGYIDHEKLIFEKIQSRTDWALDSELLQFIRFRYALDVKSPSLPSVVASIKPLLNSLNLPFSLLYFEFLLLSGDYTQCSTFNTSILVSAGYS